jgi:hypothetical protein
MKYILAQDTGGLLSPRQPRQTSLPTYMSLYIYVCPDGTLSRACKDIRITPSAVVGKVTVTPLASYVTSYFL